MSSSGSEKKKQKPPVVLRMTSVSKRYPGTLAVDKVDFKARAGEVHALMGENGAGKSTLMKILAGSFPDYTGRISIHENEVKLFSPALAKANGIGMIYQELSLARPISIAENILVGRLPVRYGFLIDKKRMVSEAGRWLERVGLTIDPALRVEEISQHEAQLVEIAKVLGNNPRILVLDEPTSALSREETERLFGIIRQLKDDGLAIIYISHHLSEIFRIADRVTVLRDGRKIASKKIRKVTPSDVVQMMVGRPIDKFYVKRKHKIGKTVLRVRNLTRFGFFHDITFSAKKGEILGLAGLSGAGRTELARSICRLDPVDRGSVDLHGRPLRAGSYGKAVSRGLLYLSENRKSDGLFLRLSVLRNLVSTLTPANSTMGVYCSGKDATITAEMIEKLKIQTASSRTEASNLSGGNQQKVLLGKCLAADPEVLILDEPTRGVDVKAKLKIHEAVTELAANGKTIILISSDLPELVGLSDRAVVMRNGHLIGWLHRDQLSEESVLLAANGQGGTAS